MEAPPDAAQARLLALARAGDAQAFGQLVAAHQSRVRQQLRRLCHGDAARADDLAQDCFLQAWRALPGFRGDARLATWLHRIAYRCFLMQQRAAGPVAVSIDTGVSADVARSRWAAAPVPATPGIAPTASEPATTAPLLPPSTPASTGPSVDAGIRPRDLTRRRARRSPPMGPATRAHWPHPRPGADEGAARLPHRGP